MFFVIFLKKIFNEKKEARSRGQGARRSRVKGDLREAPEHLLERKFREAPGHLLERKQGEGGRQVSLKKSYKKLGGL